MTITSTDDATEAKLTYIYVIGPAGSSVVKIGKADDVERRLPSLQTGSPHKLEVLKTFRCERAMETALHRRFKPLRLHGEWFDFGDLDPATEVARAVPEIESELAAARELRIEVRDALEVDAEVYLIGGRLRVMPSHLDGGWQCVGRNAAGRRCKGWANIRAMECGPTWVEWVLYGLGCVSGQSLDELGPGERGPLAAIQEQALRQLCDRHFEDGSHGTAAEPAWELFDLASHLHLIREFGLAEFALAPGFENFHEKIRVHAQKLLAQ